MQRPQIRCWPHASQASGCATTPAAAAALLLRRPATRVRSGMTGQAALPLEIRRLGVHAVRVEWADGHVGDYPNAYLRDHCPCAECGERKRRRALPVVGGQAPELYAVQIGLVGRYAISIQWSDGHDTGIYSYRTLRELCPCARCQVPAAAEGTGGA